MFDTILVPYDGSDHSQRALSCAVQLADSTEPVTIIVLHAVQMVDSSDPSFLVAMKMAEASPLDLKDARSMFDRYIAEHEKEVKERIGEYFSALPDNIDIKIVVVEGKPQEVIKEYAEDDQNDIECIIMGRRGLGAIRGALGSVSFSVLHNVDLPIMLVR
ncbi:MAG: universal stress protein [Actinomycetota bacterium]|nr:universal stress protein [Actinomycetota bacterium]